MGILIGGRSRRMGRDKALIDVGGESLLARTIRIAQTCTQDCVLVGDPPFSLSDSLAAIRRVPDGLSGAGPTGGLAGLMAAFPDADVLLLACDMPKLSAELLEWITREAATCDADAIVPETIEAGRARVHPCCAIYRGSARPQVDAAIADGRFGMTAMLERLSTCRVRVAGEMAGHLLNWNTPLDLLGGTRTGNR